MSQHVIKNPIIPGFYPDPSICRVGEDYYLVCSSFEMYPGIPVFHSKDLAHWTQISYAMTMDNDFHVDANIFCGGVMAPTIRYHESVFYIINANFADKGNFIVTATDPAGPWSKPHWLMDDVPGIDASLFFDSDGKAYVIGTGNVVERTDGTRDRGIWLKEFDIKTMKSVGEMSVLWDCALRNASSPEAPHLYKVGDYYYLIIAEGGTEHYHAVTVARSKDLRGWYEGNRANPVMTHRHLGFYYPIDNAGHADLVETPDGNWYAVLLASRIIEGQHKNLGRETYLCPVIWEREWPVFSPTSGKVDWEYPADENLPWCELPAEAPRDEFDQSDLQLSWSFWGTPYQDFWRIEDSCLKLKCLKRSMSEPLKKMSINAPEIIKDNCASFLGRRQQHINFEAFCALDFTPQGKETAGLILMQASNHQLRLEKALEEETAVLRLVLVTTEFEVPPYFPNFTSQTKTEVLVSVPYKKPTVIIGLQETGQRCDFYYGETEDNLKSLYENADAKQINPEIVGGMVGTMIGMFASGNGTDSNNEAVFDWFQYKEL